MTAFWWGVLMGALTLGGVTAGLVLLMFWPLIKARAKRDLRNEAAGEDAWVRAPFADNGGTVVDRRRSPDFNLVTRPDTKPLRRAGFHY